MRPLPWATALAACAAFSLYFVSGAEAACIFDRQAIAAGAWWRLFTGSWVHFTPSHLGWNLAVLIPAGIWAERLQPWRARALYLVGPFAIGGALYAIEPQLLRYGGLSGLAAAFVTFLALAQLRTDTEDRWFWRSVLALVALKIVAEVVVASPLLAHFSDPSIRSVPVAHLAGVLAGAIVLYVKRRGARR